ncbi:MAG: hypothetical protein RR199_07205 [Alistipes sp.]
MKKHSIFSLVALCCVLLVTSCSKDEIIGGNVPPTPPTPPTPPIEASLTASATSYRVTTLDPALNFGSTASYHWSVEQAASELYSLTEASAEKALFLTSAAGDYKLKLTAENAGTTYIRHITVAVSAPEQAPSPYIAKVYDFLPAPGQFTNKMPEYTTGDTQAQLITKAAAYVVGKKNGGLVSLGGFGGYIVFGFDHTIANVEGKRDFRVMGNAFFADANPNPSGARRGGSCEPGIILVAYDANKNGTPDDDEWYEIAGSEYAKPATKKGYEMTYYRPTSEEAVPDDDMFVAIRDYIRWTDNLGATGYKIKNTFYAQSYYPSWITADHITYKGTLLPPNGVNESEDPETQYWVLYAYGYGYADNALNNEDDSAIDISWAVNAKGEKVELPGIDFVKVQNGINQECGWLGENSTEVAGAYDLHLAGESIATVR